MEHDRDPPDRPFLPDLAQSLGLLVLGAVVFGLPASFAIFVAQRIGLDVGFQWAMTFVGLGTIWIGHRWSEAPWSETLPVGPVRLHVLPGFLLALGGIILVGHAFASATATLLPPVPPSVVARFGRIHPLHAVVAAPVLEEALFRGVVLRGYRRAYARGTAVLLCATVFAAWHVLPWQMPLALVFGAFASWLAIETGSLVLPVAAHAAVNAAGWFAAGRPDLLPDGYPGGASPWVLGAVLLAAGIALVRAAHPSPHPRTSSTQREVPPAPGS